MPTAPPNPAKPADTRMASVYGRSAAATLIGRGCMYAAAFPGLWLAIRILGPTGFGDFAWAMAVVWLLGVAATLGCDQLVLIYAARRGPDAPPGVARRLLMLVLAGGAILALAAALLVQMLPDLVPTGDRRRWLLALLGITPMLAATAVLESWNVARGRLWLSQLVVPLAQAARLPLLAVVWLLGGGAAGVLAAEWTVVVAPVLVLLASDGWLRGAGGERLDATLARKGPALFCGRLLFEATRRSDLVLLGLFAAAPAVAAFAVAGRLMVLVEAGRDLLQPGFTGRAGAAVAAADPAALTAEFRFVQSGSLLAGLAATAALLLTSPILLPLFDVPPATVAPLALLASAVLANVGTGPGAYLLNLLGRTGPVLAVRFGMLLVLVAAALALIPERGSVGAAAAALAAMLFANACYGGLMRQEGLTMLPRTAALVLGVALAVLGAIGAGIAGGVAGGLALLALTAAFAAVQLRDWHDVLTRRRDFHQAE